MEAFVYQPTPVRAVFGAGSIARLPAELDLLSVRHALVLTTPQQAELGRHILSLLDGRGAGLFAEATMHTPVDVTERAMQSVSALNVDGFVAVGGGSTTGLAKAIASRTGLPQIAVPTTYAGSEMTPILGETNAGLKVTRADPAIFPKTAVYDVELTLTLPPALTATSGMNAIAHAAEALYARDANPIVSLMAEDGIRALSRGLPFLAEHPHDIEARSIALYGAYVCGICLGSVGMALHHKLCHTLGGTFDLPHSETHAILLPHTVAYNASAAPQAIARISRALDATDAAEGLYALAGRLGVSRALKDLGMPRDGIDRATDLALTNAYWNPRPLERDAIRALLERAWAGDAPSEQALQ